MSTPKDGEDYHKLWAEAETEIARLHRHLSVFEERIKELEALFPRMRRAMSAHGPCDNNGCEDCDATYALILSLQKARS